jgi:hypothetical protein
VIQPRASRTKRPLPKRRSLASLQPMTYPASEPSESVVVLSLGEAAMCLGMSGEELAGMIEAGLIKALPTGFTLTIPLQEVERLKL